MPLDGVDETAIEFANEIAPQSRPRDQAGKFVATKGAPEPMFGQREIEGDPLTGDTRDGGDNEGLRARERAIADGRPQPPAKREPDDDEVEDVERDPEHVGASDVEEGDDEAPEQDNGQKYEVTVDGRPHEVTLKEALNGYVRQATFHQRLQQLNARQQEQDQNENYLQQNWAWWNKMRADYEEDLANLIPKEPNWDQEFARDPQSAYAQRKVFEALYAKLAQSRQMRVEREQYAAQENDRRVQKYAVDGFSKFVMDNLKSLPDEPALQKNLRSMRLTAAAAGFNDYEIATVYDPRMLTILLKASKWDRSQLYKLKPTAPDKGKALAPGAATPLGNARRSGFDDAQRRLAQSGRLTDAVEVFRRML